ncbi:prepilin-type N-terminal cleavage/methylation domain-containing protein [Salinimicrobium sp. MT39]|uniref:Prepilin-type N-terminal cleavage/methylation domain-containing protein n=1 Tax=Salinimicrobium profundisediminis TaxID=2994553 RepID=A0A9X3CYR7_9FLAO|nr:prepilin-type N-terminal cleavage/methylation domain-containing protein [Salinimicrobium profundisediminis]MCX2839432.1 prepilin-type N-terminal cleavage/methylation domain-containing protein [Salinimicrobium profundisediminis]
MRIKKIPSFNLQEMLIVLAILGILLLIALPNFMPLISKTKAQEAQIQLKYISNLQRQFQYLHSKYSADFNEINYEAPRTVLENGSANYRYEVTEASVNTYKVRATAVVDFDGDGIYNVWEIDNEGNPKQIIKD